jgi:predicted transcriptional regulator
MLTPHEVAVKSVIPAIRGLLAKKLVKEYAFTQKGAASLLGVSQSAISRYDSDERGVAIDLSAYLDVASMIEGLSRKIAEGSVKREEILKKIDDISDYVIRKGYMCDLHRKVDPEANSGCSVCLGT